MPKARTRNPKQAPAPPPAGPASLAKLLGGRVDDLRRLAGEALRGADVEAVHQARVATRRLKAAIDLLQPLLPDGPRRDVAKALRSLRRALGPVRDADVMLLHLADMKPPSPCAAGAEWAAARLRERRADAARKAAKKLSPRRAAAKLAAWSDLEPAVRSAQNAAGLLLAQAAPGRVRDFAARADRVARGTGASTEAPSVEGGASAPAMNGAAPSHAASPEPAPSDEAPSDDATSGEAPPDPVPYDRAPCGEASPDEAPSDQAHSDAAPSDEVPSEEASSTDAPSNDVPPDDVHELRVAGKLLRYTLELAEPLGVAVPKSVAKEFKKLQEALGLWHDYAVLTAELLRLAVDADLPAGRPELFTSVLHLARAAWARAERHLAQFRALWAAGGARLTEKVVGAFAQEGGVGDKVRG